MKPHLLLIGGWNEILQKAAALPVTISLFQKAELLTEVQMNLAHHLSVFDYGDADAAVDQAAYIHRVRPVDAVVSFTEYGLEPAALIREHLGVRGNPLSPVAVTRDKRQMRALMHKAGLTPVPFRVCRSAAEAAEFRTQVGGPVVLKPVLGSGSEGVAFLDELSDPEHAWAWATGIGGGPVMAEAFLDGPEYSVEALTLDGVHRILAITEKVTTGYPHFIETGHRMPAPLPGGEQEVISSYVAEFLDLIGHQVGPSHTELRLTARGPRVIESHTRPGGDRIWEMVELTTGVDVITATVEHLLLGGTQALLREYVEQGAAVIRFFCPGPGVVRRVDGVDSARAVPGIVRAVCRARAGDRLGPMASSDSRPGYILAAGPTLAIAGERLERAWRLVTLDVDQEVRP